MDFSSCEEKTLFHVNGLLRETQCRSQDENKFQMSTNLIQNIILFLYSRVFMAGSWHDSDCDNIMNFACLSEACLIQHVVKQSNNNIVSFRS